MVRLPASFLELTEILGADLQTLALKLPRSDFEDWQFCFPATKFEGRWRQWQNVVERTPLLPSTTPWQRGI
jgi:hypothetical protein